MKEQKFVFNDGGRKDAGFKGETRDCVCRSIAIVTGVPYGDVYRWLAMGNKTQRAGKRPGSNNGIATAAKGINTRRKWFKDLMKILGFVWVPTMKVGAGCKVHLKKDELPSGKLVVAVSRHFTAVIDGVIYDTHDCSRGGTRCVYGYFIYKNPVSLSNKSQWSELVSTRPSKSSKLETHE